MERQEDQRTKSMFVGAMSAVGIGAWSFCIEAKILFFLFPCMAIGVGIAIGYKCITSPEVRPKLGWRYVPTIVASVLAVLIGTLSLGFSLLIRL